MPAHIKIQHRIEELRRRKNFLPTLIITIILWLILAGIVYFIDPQQMIAIPLFFLITFLAILFTASLLFANRRRGLLTSLVIMLFLILRYFGVGNMLNAILLVGIAVAFEIYASRKA